MSLIGLSNQNWHEWPSDYRAKLLERIQAKATEREAPHNPFAAYQGRPVDYARQVLRVEPTPDQIEILNHLHIAPYRVLVPSGHSVGKSFCGAVACNYWFDVFNPGIIISTAPSARDVKDVLWAEIRLQRQRANLSMPFSGPVVPEMYTSPEHWAKGYTASKGEGYQGRHRPRMLFIMDEANGIAPAAWLGFKTMFDPSQGHAMLCFFNPTSTTSQAYVEDMQADGEDGIANWHRFRLSSANHPNLMAELDGKPKPIPGAVSLAMFQDWLRDWCEPVSPGDEQATDFPWPPLEWCEKNGVKPKWYRPGPDFQARALGIWPEAGDGVWSPVLWEACLRGPCPAFPVSQLPELGCDTATGKGEDYHARHGRWGSVSVLHETSNTMDPARIFSGLKDDCQRLADKANERRHPSAARIQPQQILIKIDDDGTGGAVAAFLRRDGYSVVTVGAGTKAQDENKYPNKRSELWFQTAGKARASLVYMGLLPRRDLARIRQQLMAPTFGLDNAGRRIVEKKEITKDKIGRSPDDADAVNLAYYDRTITASPENLPDPATKRRHWWERK